MSIFKAIGVMSGTSLDGVDLVYCIFDKKQGQWEYKIIKSITIEYDAKWKNRLSNAHKLSAIDLTKLDFEYGDYLGRMVSAFIKRQHLTPKLVASHGHTVFHNPAEGYTLQIGKAAAISAHLSCKLVSDFRSQDVALGGQGAPLVPIGDELLFTKYKACINLGGVANISLNKDGKRIAWDIGFCNMPLNYLMKDFGLEYDKGGKYAAEGEVNIDLLRQLNNIEYYNKQYPKTLGREQFEKEILPLFESSKANTKDKLRTWVEHISEQISMSIKNTSGEVMLTGGGAFNTLLTDRILSKTKTTIIIPNKQLVDSKEALIFAFLGVLCLEDEVNVLSSVTGAKTNHCSGIIS